MTRLPRLILYFLLLGVSVVLGNGESSARTMDLRVQFVGEKDANFQVVVQRAAAEVLLFSEKHQLKIKRQKDFVDSVVWYESKSKFDKMISTHSSWPKGTPVPATYVGVGLKKEFHVVSWDAYKVIHPADAERDYHKLLVHELTHLLHIAALDGREDDMGPMWFFEGLACFAADQYPNAPNLSRKRIEEILSDTKRGSYAEYVAAFRRLTKKESLSALIKKAGSKDFTAWAKTAFVESESQND